MSTLEVATKEERIRYIKEIGSFKREHQEAMEKALEEMGSDEEG